MHDIGAEERKIKRKRKIQRKGKRKRKRKRKGKRERERERERLREREGGRGREEGRKRKSRDVSMSLLPGGCLGVSGIARAEGSAVSARGGGEEAAARRPAGTLGSDAIYTGMAKWADMCIGHYELSEKNMICALMAVL